MILRWFVCPRFAEEITIETEALTYNRLFLLPSLLLIYDEAGQELIHMMATFVLMDRDSRKVHAVEPRDCCSLPV